MHFEIFGTDFLAMANLYNEFNYDYKQQLNFLHKISKKVLGLMSLLNNYFIFFSKM